MVLLEKRYSGLITEISVTRAFVFPVRWEKDSSYCCSPSRQWQDFFCVGLFVLIKLTSERERERERERKPLQRVTQLEIVSILYSKSCFLLARSKSNVQRTVDLEQKLDDRQNSKKEKKGKENNPLAVLNNIDSSVV